MIPESASERSASGAEPVAPDGLPDGLEEPGDPEEPEAVLVRVPADPDYLPVIRSASAHVATKFGGTLTEVSDLRLAVDEACGLLLRYTVPAVRVGGVGDLECRFVLEDLALRVVLSRRAEDATPPDSDDFGWTILGALVDELVWRVEGSTVRVEILMRRGSGE